MLKYRRTRVEKVKMKMRGEERAEDILGVFGRRSRLAISVGSVGIGDAGGALSLVRGRAYVSASDLRTTRARCSSSSSVFVLVMLVVMCAYRMPGRVAIFRACDTRPSLVLETMTALL